MGVRFVQTKPVPIHTETKGQEKEPVRFLPFKDYKKIFYKAKVRLLLSQGHRQVQEGATSQKLDGVKRKWGPGRPPGLQLRSSPSSRRPASFRLDVRRVFLVFILIEEAGAVAAALALGAALDSAAGGAVDLH